MNAEKVLKIIKIISNHLNLRLKRINKLVTKKIQTYEEQ
jgi:hypothetical protein